MFELLEILISLPVKILAFFISIIVAVWRILSYILRLPAWVVIGIIAFYQKWFSPDHGHLVKGFFPDGYCKFEPSCSEYAKKSVEKHGLLKGFWKGFWRVLRCNPWSEGGKDDI